MEQRMRKNKDYEIELPVCVIGDADPSYVRQLTVFLNEDTHIPFMTEGFSDFDRLQTYLQENEAAMLMISEEWMEKYENGAGGFGDGQRDTSKIHLLCLTEDIDKADTLQFVYKYQRAQQIKQKLIAAFASYGQWQSDVDRKGARKQGAKSLLKGELVLIGIYSPLGRCGKTSFAIALGEMLAMTAPTLYLNLEEYSGFSAMVSEGMTGETLSDLLYFQQQGYGSVQLHLGSMIRTFRKLDYIAPAAQSWDIRETPVETWMDLFGQIEAGKAYRYLVLDLGPQVKNVFQLLDICTKVYVPVLGDAMSKEKIKQFQDNLLTQDYRKLQEKIRYLTLPGVNEEPDPETFPVRLLKSRMGQCAREVASGIARV